jgi:hypothetical protein
MSIRHALPLIALLPAFPAFAATTYYVSTAGNDASNGTSLGSSFATVAKAVSLAQAGDTILVRGGTYSLSNTLALTAAGTSAAPITVANYNNETPILDFSAEAAGKRGIQLDGNYWNLTGLTVRNAKDNGVNITGSNNTINRLDIYGNQDSGLQLSGSTSRQPSNNLILNTDSHANYDPAGHGENADGFAAKFRDLGPGNVFDGDRAWGNSDDGWDFWEARNGVTVKNSWSFKNGFNTFGDSAFAGDGNGFKLGHDSGTHTLQNLLVWGNRLNGVDVNGNATAIELPADPITHGVTVENVTAYNNGAGGNGYNFNFDESFPHTLKNDISYIAGLGGANGVKMNTGVLHDHNTWDGSAFSVDANDFLSLSDAIATGARLPDGSLPTSDFLHLVQNSNLVDAGTYVGQPYNGSAPDLGAYETAPTPEPASLLTLAAAAPALLLLRRRKH